MRCRLAGSVVVALALLLLLVSACGESTTGVAPHASFPETPSAYEGLPTVLVYRVEDDDPQATVNITIEGPSPVTFSDTVTTNQDVRWTVPEPLVAGAYTVTVSAVDPSGNSSNATVPLSVEAGAEPEPSAPLTSPAAEQGSESPYFARMDLQVSDPNPAQYSNVTVSCTTLDQYGAPISGAQVTFTWHYRTETPVETSVTGSDGVAACERYISGATAGYAVEVTVHAEWQDWYADDGVSFTPY
jgi:hypothetical protein